MHQKVLITRTSSVVI